MRTPAISLILATVGRTDQLDRLFDSLVTQTFNDFEVVVVDQNADDRVQPHIERAKYLGIKVKHFKQHPPNLAAARNAGIAAAKGKWIGFPDDDCWYDVQLLARLVARFNRADSPDGVVARWVEQDEQPMSPANLSWERFAAFRDVPVSSITLFCHRRVFDKIGGFDERLGVGQYFGAGEETDFVMRALRSGAFLTYDPTAEVHHAVSSAALPADAKVRQALRHRARGTGALYAKHHLPLWVIARGLAAPVLRPLMKGAFGADLALGCAVMRGRLDGMLGWRRKQT